MSNLTGAQALLHYAQSGTTSGVAVALDLHEVPYSENPLFRRAIMDLVDQFARQFQPEIIDLGPTSQIFLFGRTSPDEFIEKLRLVSHDFLTQHMHAPRHMVFRLPRDAGTLAGFIKARIDAAPKPLATLSPVEAKQLESVHNLAIYEHTLAGSDLSAVVRESPVWARHDGDWRLIYGEVTVALDHLERAVGVPLRRDPWLLRQIAPTLDACIIRHFRDEQSRLRTPHAMNLLCETVLSDRFQSFVRELTYDRRRNLIVELSARQEGMALLPDAIDNLRLWDCRVAIDHLSLRQADPCELPLDQIDYLKVDISGTGAGAGDWPARLPDWIRDFGAGRVIALYPDNADLLAHCLVLGFDAVETRIKPPPVR